MPNSFANFGYDVHIHIPVTGADLALKTVLFLGMRPLAPYKCLPTCVSLVPCLHMYAGTFLICNVCVVCAACTVCVVCTIPTSIQRKSIVLFVSFLSTRLNLCCLCCLYCLYRLYRLCFLCHLCHLTKLSFFSKSFQKM